MNSLDTRFAQKLHAALVEELNDAHKKLANGSQVIRDDAAATGMNCVKYIGLIEGLETALSLTQKIENEMFDRKSDN